MARAGRHVCGRARAEGDAQDDEKRGERKRTSTLADAIRKTKEAEKKQDLHDLIDKVGAKASMVTEGTKSFLSINVLPRYV